MFADLQYTGHNPNRQRAGREGWKNPRYRDKQTKARKLFEKRRFLEQVTDFAKRARENE